jgi:hypothetical protein
MYICQPFVVIRGGIEGIETGYGLDDRGVGVRVSLRSRIFNYPFRPVRYWGPPRLLSNVQQELFPPGVKQQGREP